MYIVNRYLLICNLSVSLVTLYSWSTEMRRFKHKVKVNPVCVATRMRELKKRERKGGKKGRKRDDIWGFVAKALGEIVSLIILSGTNFF